MKYFYIDYESGNEESRKVKFEDFTSDGVDSFKCPYCGKETFTIYTDYEGRAALFCIGCLRSVHLINT